MTQEQTVVLETAFPDLNLFSRGKVRDVYDAGDHLLFIATDRISAFDCILPTGIPGKGSVLTQLSVFWFDYLGDLTPTHFVTTDTAAYPSAFRPYAGQLAGRSMLVRRAKMIDVECVARGYLAGSGWKEYRANGTVCGIPLPPGLEESGRLPTPIFTPATKAQSGHDENISFERLVSLVGDNLASRLRDLTLSIYGKAASYALSRGIILADTKFEFGFIGDQLVLADEVLTPDSSRFWPADRYQPGRAQDSFDKQYVRDYLETLAWDKTPPAPPLPPEVAARTGEKYREAYRRLTGRDLSAD